MEMKEANKEIIRTLFEEFINQGKVEQLSEIISENYVDLVSGRKGLSVYQDSIRSVRTGFPDIKFEIKEVLADGNKVVVRWQWTGTHEGIFNGIQPTHQKAKTDGTVIFELERRKVVSSFANIDRLGLLQQIGVVGRL